MESLQAYYDSESDSMPEDEAPETRNKSNLTNYFGLDLHKTSVADYKKFSFQERKGTESLLENNSNANEDIPDGNFWKSFVPDKSDDGSYKEVSTLESNKIPISSNSDEKKDLGSIQNYSKKRSCKDSGACELKEKQIRYSNEVGIINKTQPSSFVHSSQQNTSQVENRKIFYVHSKAAPYLSSNPVCKCTSRSVAVWQSHDKSVNRIAWNRPNYSHLVASAGMDSLVKIWNVWSSLDRCISVIRHHTKAVRNVIWGFQGKDIISCSYDKTAIVADVETGAMKSRYMHQGFVMACTAHPCNPHCFVTGIENAIQFWDQRTPISPTRVFTYKNEMGQPQDLLFIQNGSELISCSDVVARESADRTIMAWDVRSGNVISNQIFQERYTCTRLKLSPASSHFLVQTQGGYVALFSTNRPYKIDKNKRYEGHEMQGYNIGFDVSPDGSFVYSGSAEGGLRCYDFRSSRLLKKCGDGNCVITDVACHPVLPSVVASCSWGGRISLWQ